MPANVFYFIAQSGSVHPRRPSAPTNFYVYTIPEIHKGEVYAEVEQAKLGNEGFVYPAKFILDLAKWDRKGRTLDGFSIR